MSTLYTCSCEILQNIVKFLSILQVSVIPLEHTSEVITVQNFILDTATAVPLH